jgi:hypothetical protein
VYCVTGVSHLAAPLPSRRWLAAALAAVRAQHEAAAGGWEPEQEELVAMALQRMRSRLLAAAAAAAAGAGPTPVEVAAADGVPTSRGAPPRELAPGADLAGAAGGASADARVPDGAAAAVGGPPGAMRGSAADEGEAQPMASSSGCGDSALQQAAGAANEQLLRRPALRVVRLPWWWCRQGGVPLRLRAPGLAVSVRARRRRRQWSAARRRRRPTFSPPATHRELATANLDDGSADAVRNGNGASNSDGTMRLLYGRRSAEIGWKVTERAVAQGGVETKLEGNGVGSPDQLGKPVSTQSAGPWIVSQEQLRWWAGGAANGQPPAAAVIRSSGPRLHTAVFLPAIDPPSPPVSGSRRDLQQPPAGLRRDAAAAAAAAGGEEAQGEDHRQPPPCSHPGSSDGSGEAAGVELVTVGALAGRGEAGSTTSTAVAAANSGHDGQGADTTGVLRTSRNTSGSDSN